MIESVVNKVKAFLLNPVETFRQSKNDEPNVIFTYFAVLLLFNAFLSAIVAALGIIRMPTYPEMTGGYAVPVITFFTMLISIFIATLIYAAWLHLWVYLLGGRRGIMQTINAVIYGITPSLLFGWIPFVGFFFTLWSLALNILGIREFQELSTGKAIITVAIAVIIPLLLIILAALFFMVSYQSFTGVPVPPGNTL